MAVFIEQLGRGDGDAVPALVAQFEYDALGRRFYKYDNFASGDDLDKTTLYYYNGWEEGNILPDRELRILPVLFDRPFSQADKVLRVQLEECLRGVDGIAVYYDRTGLDEGFRARSDLPLLTHGGHELAAQGGGHQEFGNPLLLRRALENGVRGLVVLAARTRGKPDGS